MKPGMLHSPFDGVLVFPPLGPLPLVRVPGHEDTATVSLSGVRRRFFVLRWCGHEPQLFSSRGRCQDVTKVPAGDLGTFVTRSGPKSADASRTSSRAASTAGSSGSYPSARIAARSISSIPRLGRPKVARWFRSLGDEEGGLTVGSKRASRHEAASLMSPSASEAGKYGT